MLSPSLSEVLLPLSTPTSKNIISILRERELQTKQSQLKTNLNYYSPGYTPDIIRSLESSYSFQHAGCVNTVNFNSEGSLLATASDDLFVKVWKSNNFIDPDSIKSLYQVPTGHYSNIFHVEFSPKSNNIILSCAADGEIRWHDLTDPALERRVASYSGMVNMFSFHDENFIFAANLRLTGGSVQGVDLRQNTRSFCLFSSKFSQVKALAPCPWENNILAVGVGEDVWFCDIRKADANSLSTNSSSYVPSCVVDRIMLNKAIFPTEISCQSLLGPFLPFHSVGHDYQGTNLARTYSDMKEFKKIQVGFSPEVVTISSIEFSSCRREILVSYQKDSVYRFDLTNQYTGEGIRSFPTQFFSGHVNDMTFLKRACYYGPEEEYVCCGGDDGNVFIYDSTSGDIVSCFLGDGINREFIISSSVNGIVNGVVPNPNGNSIVTYGLDSHAKLWTVNLEREEKDDEKDNDTKEQSCDCSSLHEKPNSYAYLQETLKMNQNQTCEETITPNLCMFLIRTTRIRENCVNELNGVSIYPSSSLILAALDDGVLGEELLGQFFGASRFEYCASKLEKVREDGNNYYQRGEYDFALEFYSIAIQYCLGACLLRLEILETTQTQDKEKLVLLKELEEITSNSTFKLKVKRKSKHKMDGPTMEQLKRIITAFRLIWDLFLICNLNAARTVLKMKFFNLALELSEQSLRIDPTNLKGKFRRACALMGLRRKEEALREFSKIQTLPDGDSALLRTYMRRLSSNKSD